MRYNSTVSIDGKEVKTEQPANIFKIWPEHLKPQQTLGIPMSMLDKLHTESPEYPIMDFSIDALLLGILADRGKVSQIIGGSSMALAIRDLHEAPPISRLSPELAITQNVRDIISKGIPTVQGAPPTPAQYQEWYLKALDLYERFQERDELRIQAGEESLFEVNSNGIRSAWNTAGFPIITRDLRGMYCAIDIPATI